jgi:hypothetical protein
MRRRDFIALLGGATAWPKALQLLKDVVPKLTRVAVLWNADNAIFQAQMLKETQTVPAY